MAGFDNDVVYANNADFSTAGAGGGSASNGLQTNGQLWIGSTATNAGGTHVNVGQMTSPLGTLSIGYSSPNITIDLSGGSTGIDSIAVPNGTSPVFPTAAGLLTFTEGTGFNITGGSSTIDFSLDGGVVGQTITGNSGGALSPTAGNWNILGLSGSKTAGSGSTLTVRSPPYADVGISGSVTLNSGSFATAAITLTTPVTAGLADGDLLEFVATNGVLVIQLAATQVAHLGSAATTVAGTITGSATGDSISLRYQASTNDWWATSAVGVWVLA